jgi:hypothetical protein
MLRSILVAAALSAVPGAALAQTVVVEPPLMPGEVMVGPPVVMMPPVLMGPPTEEDARMIAMAHGVVVVEDVDHRFWDGNYEVEGEDQSGDDIEVLIDGQSGAVLEIDD